MKKIELIEMLKDVDDNAEIVFIQYYHDRDGWLAKRYVEIEKVEAEKKD